MEASRTRNVPSAVSLSFSLTSSLEMSPQYHSASCSAMLLFIPLLVTDVGLGGFGGRAASGSEESDYYIVRDVTGSSTLGLNESPGALDSFSTPLIKREGGGAKEGRVDDAGVGEKEISFRKKASTEYSRYRAARLHGQLRIIYVDNKNMTRSNVGLGVSF